MMLINGETTPFVDPQDRGLLYGDGLFETIAVQGGRLVFWTRHLARLEHGCHRLQLPPPDGDSLSAEARRVCADKTRAVLKVIVTRGPGGRGYRPPERPDTRRIVAAHPWPNYPSEYWQQGVTVRVCQTRLGLNPALAGLKHLNRLEQVLARGEWNDPTIAEGLMLDTEGNVIEGTVTNLFAVKDQELMTPELSRCGVAGIARDCIITLAGGMGIPVHETRLELDHLLEADEVFLCNSLIGIWPVRCVGEILFEQHSYTRQFAQALAAWKNGSSGP